MKFTAADVMAARWEAAGQFVRMPCPPCLAGELPRVPLQPPYVVVLSDWALPTWARTIARFRYPVQIGRKQ